MNNYFKNQFDNNSALLPPEILSDVEHDFSLMSDLGIDNEKDQSRFYVIRIHTPQIIRGILNRQLPEKACSYISADVFKKAKNINSMIELINAVHESVQRMVPGDVEKFAYPQGEVWINPRPSPSLERWMQATRDIYTRMQKGQNQTQAKQEVLGDWDMKEKTDYEAWLRFYQEKVPEKYPKLASIYESPDTPGYILPNPVRVNQLKSYLPAPVLEKEIPGSPSKSQTDVSNADTINAQRKKIINRLNAAENLLSSSEGVLFAGEKLEELLKILHYLKLKIQTSYKKTAKSTLFEDFIYREANFLANQGFLKEAAFFEKIAQMPDLGLTGPTPDLSAMPDLGTGSGTEAPAPTEGTEEDTRKLLKEFFDNLQNGVADGQDQRIERRKRRRQEREDRLSKASVENDDIIVLAQEVPDVTTETPVAPTNAKEDQTDDLIDAALRNISVHDVISRLEMLVKVYNQREISRQLAILDIMMDRAGLASFFPGLGEAMGKALESNQYIATRLSDILTKLKGSLTTSGENWIAPTIEHNPNNEGVRQNLMKQQQEEDAKRQLRKERDEAKLKGAGEQLVSEEVAPTAEPKIPNLPAPDVPTINTPVRIDRSKPIDAR